MAPRKNYTRGAFVICGHCGQCKACIKREKHYEYLERLAGVDLDLVAAEVWQKKEVTGEPFRPQRYSQYEGGEGDA